MIQPPSVGPSTGATTVAIAVNAEGACRARGRKGVEDDRLLVRLQAAAEKALQQPKDDQLGEIGGDAAEERADRERRECR